ncbi:peptidoglycan/xylan/chitin deacetylase (PgdA/CDA1 family) [Hydrogenispora ethanolica]|uniref:Peptidoglycan/xylan/chitin deacetylase (PgdA/CDA1 family) n=2 Tax=Hydrogenispora ethanolica TaxID=1082276 RepID=A0A4R1R8N1_HYDET|nr:peptidoglycan/xylan/chitin deacetylase (PgdA/CDA1 family) [Hydrogenispora ethanolica]
MMNFLVRALIALWIVIYPGCDYFVRLWARGVVRRGPSGPEPRLCLTFDDGPNPEVTPRVLDTLKELRIRAVFFLVGAKARQHPELVRRMLAEGHEVGLHTLEHRHAYWMFRRQSRRAVEEGARWITAITGRPLRWFRPPWGACNLFQWLTVRRMGLRLVLWSANAQDWRAATGRAGILRRLRQRVKPGAVVVLHDGGGEAGAPLNTLQALPEFIRYYLEEGWRFVTLEELDGKRYQLQ